MGDRCNLFGASCRDRGTVGGLGRRNETGVTVLEGYGEDLTLGQPGKKAGDGDLVNEETDWLYSGL